MKLSVVILAAGRGKRMRSALPKVLQPLGGEPLLAHVIEGARPLSPEQTVVVIGHGAEAVREAFGEAPLHWAEQHEQLGTGHAVMQALPQIPDDHVVLVLYGDVPLVSPATQKALVEAATDSVAVLTAELPDPSGYGRILRNSEGLVEGIVEHKDASPEQRGIREINTGLLAAPAGRLRDWLSRVGNDNAQGEYYLTDIIALAASDGVPVRGVVAHDDSEIQGVNNRIQLAEAEAILRGRRAQALMEDGVTLADPTRIDIRGRVECGRDVFIDANVLLEGEVQLGDGVHIGPGCVIRNSQIAAGTVIDAHTVLEQARVGSDARIGPFARLRPGSHLAARARIGNFVETKNVELGEGSKVNHLSYIGDATVGRDVNVGAGTITCNYDGANKHQTIIGDGAFIGSDTQLVAPVTVGAHATIGAGSTINKDAPAGELTLSRSKQKTLEGWKRPQKK
ncbi:bifunctional UDP-N-acetylglucosamine diphosphorylase/glucosamine-1-phosphate N-acetyltransferase GlmU [Natronospira bacteriovora]|uniref:Bifunctional protein GlmU n=1 Tax=Natronospira bacteriovora TaxID=3069753 RepID=A0ABU0W7H4_9GAMM|nr:bifunctional UDP-N-acetylglucosamine diphosphorylase/glucosamine-1-phosphate N-acetyltransferase GlmU [Natronospira sp. AB-CW4]MDQ2069718.1 bifunctional UDP-N-acetylglucosamine diphosphorylase/glucosamine-1-phosphate N-acetyltransferase GlmU [Natronospira sp. AB-CW4]